MTATSTILALVFYPLLFNLPLNFVRLRWGFRYGMDPMPLEVQERAQAADRLVYFVQYTTLLTFVSFLLYRSLISGYEIGLRIENWKSAVALGALLSFVPLILGAIWQRIVPPDKRQEEPEFYGSLAGWYGLTLLGSFAVELWRVYCIAALLRLDLSGWLAVLLAALAYGVSQWTTSTARAVGAATFGGIAGFLFVKTGSLLAPFTMSLILGIAQLYRVRHLGQQVANRLVAIESIVDAHIKERTRLPRQHVLCPVCNTRFNSAKVKRTITTFTCPNCDEVLTYETRRFDYFLFAVSVYGIPIVMYLWGFRGFTLISASFGGAVVVLLVGTSIYNLFSPAKAVLRESVLSLRLVEKSQHGEDYPRKK